MESFSVNGALKNLKPPLQTKRGSVYKLFTNSPVQVIVVRELSFKYPDEGLPEEWKEVEPVLKNSKELIWIAEYNSACVNALHSFIGSPDERYRPAAKYFSTREGKSTLNAILQKFQSTKVLDLNRTIPLPTSVEGEAALDFVLDSIPASEIKVLHYTSSLEQAVEGSDKILPLVFARLPNVLELSLAGSGGIVSNQTVKEICSRYPLLVKLDLEQCIELTSEAAKHIKDLEHLTELNLGKISSLKDEAVAHLAAGSPKLEVLKIGFAEVTHKSFENVSKITNLKELEFPFRLKKHEDAKKYLEGHPNVKVKMEPIVFDCKDFNGTWRPAVVKSFSATQTAVHYYGQQDYNDDLLNKTQFHEKTAEYKTHKEEYGAEDSSHASTDCPMCEALHADLEHVKFGGVRNMHFINDWYFEEPDGIEFLKSFLENAEKGQVLFNSYSLQPGLKFTTVLKALFKTHPCEKITEFYMDLYSNWDGLADALKALPNLKVYWNTLSATEMTEIQPLADALPPIEELYWSAYLSDKCAEYLATKIPNVTTMYLWLTYSEMTEKGFSALLPEDNKVQNLTIRNYPKLSPEILQKIAQNCKNVVTLDLTMNEGLVQEVDDVVVHLIKGFPSLKKLILDAPITKSEKFAEFKNARPDVVVDDGCYTRDVQDIYRSTFYPAIQVSQTKGPNPTVNYHEYGTGTEVSISLNNKEDEAKVKPFLSNVSTYGPQDSYHSTNDCFYCSLLHPFCEKIQFSGLPNKFFQNDWFFDGEEGKTLVTKFVPQGPENRIVFNIPLPDGIREWAIVRALSKTAEPEKTFTVNFPSTVSDIGKLLAQPLNITAIEFDRDFYYQPDIFKQISTKRPKLTHLTLEGYQNEVQTWEKFNLPELLHLDLTGCNLADNVIDGIAKSTKLTSLNLSGTQLTDKTIEVLAKNWTNLTSLNLRRLDITEKSVEAICQNCPNLQSLNLVLCHKVPATVCKLIQEGLPNLKELRVPYQWIQAEMLNQLKAAKPELTVLEKTELIDANEGNVWYPAVILEETARSYFVHLYGYDGQPWILKSDNKLLAPIFTNKEKYGKQWPEHFSAKEKCKFCEILHPLCEHFKFGTSRNLAFINDWFFDSHEGKVFVNQLATQVKATGKLDLSMNLPAGLSFEKTAITALDTIPAELIKHVSFPKPVSTETFEHLLSDKPNLLSLSLLGPFTDEHASVVADKCSDSLTTLSLIGCSITDAGLSAIANRNQLLEFLTIKNCKQITDKGVETLLLASKSLDTVDLDFQYQPLTAASVKILAKVPTLAFATLSWGYKQKEIDDEVSFLKKKKPNTKIGRGLVLYDCLDTANSWFPCVVKDYNEEEKKVFVHYYGWGENYDAWLDLDGADKLTDAWTHTEDYGSLYSSHFKDGCQLCNQLHQYCKGHTFSGNKLSFYLGY